VDDRARDDGQRHHHQRGADRASEPLRRGRAAMSGGLRTATHDLCGASSSCSARTRPGRASAKTWRSRRR
jgi:hypothetical protein